MITDVGYVIYLIVYILTIIYFTILGCYMLAQRGNVMSTHGELMAKLRMTRTMGVAMFCNALGWFIYLPPMLLGYQTDHPIYKVLFLVALMLGTPMNYIVMFAVVQRKVDILSWACALSAPFLLLAIWNSVDLQNDTPHLIGAVLCLVCLVSMLIRFASEYRNYVHRIQSEYSETTHREILWSWVCFSGLAMQVIVFVVYMFLWSPLLEILYLVLSVLNAACLCYCTCRQKTIDLDVVEDGETAVAVSGNNKEKERVFYATIEQKLEMHCEDQLLFLEPDLTREQLCHRLSISSTYLKMYFHSRGLTFYQYINTLRVEYAYKLMQANPDMAIGDICEQSGFRSQTTFRKMFQEVLGCLPSEVRSKAEEFTGQIITGNIGN